MNLLGCVTVHPVLDTQVYRDVHISQYRCRPALLHNTTLMSLAVPKVSFYYLFHRSESFSAACPSWATPKQNALCFGRKVSSDTWHLGYLEPGGTAWCCRSSSDHQSGFVLTFPSKVDTFEPCTKEGRRDEKWRIKPSSNLINQTSRARLSPPGCRSAGVSL